MDSTRSSSPSNSTSAQELGSKSPSINDSIHQPVEELAQQGKEKVGQMADQIKSGVQSTLSDQKGRLADTLGAVSESLHDACHKLEGAGGKGFGSYLHSSHEAVDRLSGYLRESDVSDIAEDVQVYAHRNPTLVVGTLFALGFLAGRFLRSSTPASASKALVPYSGPPRSQRLEVERSWR
jgi:ElaB/YqjD/DUF883 family membrane-anchored ribosome-binding protein